MSTELGEVRDCIRPDEYSVGVALGTGGIRLFSNVNKIWLDVEGANELIELLETAVFITRTRRGQK